MAVNKKTDIDIDIADRDTLLKHLHYTDASIINNSTIKKHNVGIYLQDVPKFLDTNLCSIDYRKTGQYGFYKLDILNNSVYESVESEQHLDELLEKEPDWTLLTNDDVIPSLFQIHRYGDDLKRWKPKSVLQLAMFIAMIRPAKKHLLAYNSWKDIEEEIWKEPEDKSEHYFKKSHSIAYASVIKIQLNLISS